MYIPQRNVRSSERMPGIGYRDPNHLFSAFSSRAFYLSCLYSLGPTHTGMPPGYLPSSWRLYILHNTPQHHITLGSHLVLSPHSISHQAKDNKRILSALFVTHAPWGNRTSYVCVHTTCKPFFSLSKADVDTYELPRGLTRRNCF